MLVANMSIVATSMVNFTVVTDQIVVNSIVFMSIVVLCLSNKIYRKLHLYPHECEINASSIAILLPCLSLSNIELRARLSAP
jgi:hypothetical protein